MNIEINTKEEAIEWIHSLKTLGIKPGLTRMEWSLERLNHPERELKFVHVAGTNGKGSTVSFISKVLSKAGYKVGTFTSPYLIDFTNRIQVGGKDIQGEDLVALVNQILPLYEELKSNELGAPTEFEVITLIAILYFSRINYPDIIIWETGLGGRLDSTNVVIPIVSVITNVSYDHMDLLGDNIKAIAVEKAGIIKTGVPVISGVENKEALEVIKNTSLNKKSNLYQLNEQFHTSNHKISRNNNIFDFVGPYLTMPEIKIKMIGQHQIKNASLALMTLELLRQYYAFYIDEDAIYYGMEKTFWPGRFEIISNSPTVIIDGAHNQEGAKSLKEAIFLFEYNRLILVTGILKDKAIKEYYQELISIADEIIVTEPDFHRAAKTEDIIKVLYDIDNTKKITTIKDWSASVNKAYQIANNDDIIIFTGSLYLISDIRRYILNEKKKVIKN